MAVHIVCVQRQGYKIIIQEILRKSGYFSTVLQNHFFSSPQKNIDYLDADPRSKDACFDKGGHQGLSSVSLSNTTLSLCFEFNETVFVQYHSGAAPFELPY